MSEALKDIKSIALQMEIDGIKFYTDMASKTFHPMGKAMFRSFIEDEKMHAKRIKTLLFTHKEAVQEREKTAINPKERLINIFQDMGDELKQKVNANTNDIEAVKLAITIEENGIKFYEQAAKDAHDRREKDVYHFLASEEEIHCTILKNTLEYLENTELWEAENEGRMYDLWVNMVSKKV
ncbi:MAG: DUF2202 domain-containing protein [Candidatus Jettenia sp.]|uniref:Putative rubrerythrin n=1 Tax=Candidatus Jettenia caeni TaxID=247490 RepID=I3INS8_9BACT|nr:ferritin family protein [Candidatus Jettenia sp. AMX1]MBC6927523.1 DUF2202 domain-containing protein [Candidatus Jettenia sp.]WKZ15833.1 MAG: ferritin family protein [Candidatus Jettenia caeni]KAA0251502.1 MAG: DUF2202 domain-containing protein [Candidatus Jettenia sp. AMX1]MCE7881360.1 DUF2202 domain-containing protein [Candidatus Jettenia sp. AMX1]MCQ3926078.1 DUF2202 domain-containing protein [Candidatus Jettenia sp.]